MHDLGMDPGTSSARVTAAPAGGRAPCTTGATRRRSSACASSATRHGLALVEDAAQSPGACFAGRKLGTFGAGGLFSFFSNKVLGVGGGGLAIATDFGGSAASAHDRFAHTG